MLSECLRAREDRCPSVKTLVKAPRKGLMLTRRPANGESRVEGAAGSGNLIAQAGVCLEPRRVNAAGRSSSILDGSMTSATPPRCPFKLKLNSSPAVIAQTTSLT